jgi:hypothetical protein
LIRDVCLPIEGENGKNREGAKREKKKVRIYLAASKVVSILPISMETSP